MLRNQHWKLLLKKFRTLWQFLKFRGNKSFWLAGKSENQRKSDESCQIIIRIWKTNINNKRSVCCRIHRKWYNFKSYNKKRRSGLFRIKNNFRRFNNSNKRRQKCLYTFSLRPHWSISKRKIFESQQRWLSHDPLRRKQWKLLNNFSAWWFCRFGKNLNRNRIISIQSCLFISQWNFFKRKQS